MRIQVLFWDEGNERRVREAIIISFSYCFVADDVVSKQSYEILIRIIELISAHLPGNPFVYMHTYTLSLFGHSKRSNGFTS